jgi:L-methionine (R)-S-oxide reductase
MIKSQKNSDKENQYHEVISQLKALIDNSLDSYTNISLILSHLKYHFNIFWIGIYWVKGDHLFLGPFQGMPACTRISNGRGVCGTAATTRQIQIVPDVTKFEGYIACHTETKSEIVLPAVKERKCLFVLDIDSIKPAFFDKTDAKYLSIISDEIIRLL